MSFVIQFPGDRSHLSTIEQHAQDAISGGGVFAFATKGGVKEFFNQPHIMTLASERDFRVIVGLDAITNTETIYYLQEKSDELPGLRVDAMLNEDASRTFHPKFTWFRYPTHSSIIAGSGNLTTYGLGKPHENGAGNWEAFNILRIPGVACPPEIQNIEDILQFMERNGQLLPLNNSRVIERAALNSRLRPIKAHNIQRLLPPLPQGNQVEAVAEINQDYPEVLVRELPLNRDGQADVGKKVLRDFFGFTGQPREILTQYVDLADLVHALRAQRIFVNRSRNYRIELREIRDLDYDIAPDNGRMILVACRLDERLFRYTLIPVATHVSHAQVSAILGPIPLAGRRLMRSAFITVEELKRRWPDVPSNLLPINVHLIAD